MPHLPMQSTGMDFIDTDGPYEQAPCGSTTHQHHRDVWDSQAFAAIARCNTS
jgi:hypothetical protein